MVRVTQKETELSWVVLNCSVPVIFFKWGEGGGEVKWKEGGGKRVDVDHLRGHPDVMSAMTLWLTRSHVELFCNVVSRLEVSYFLKL